MLRKIFLILILNMVNGLEWYEKGNPIFLEGDQIKKSLEQKDQIKVVKFFVSWCGHCRTLKRYVDNYKKNKELNEGFNIYEINCDVSPQYCTEVDVHSFPMMYVFDQNGELIDQLNGIYPEHIIWSFIDEYNLEALKFLPDQSESISQSQNLRGQQNSLQQNTS